MPDLFQLLGQILVLLRVVGGVLLGFLAVAVGAYLDVDLLDLLQAALDLIGALVLQIKGVLLCDGEIRLQLLELLLSVGELAPQQ